MIASCDDSMTATKWDAEFQPLVVSDVADRRRDERFSPDIHRRQRDLRGKLGAVPTAAEDLDPRAHLPQTWVPGIALAVSVVVLVESLRNQHLDVVPEQLLSAVAEQLLGPTVHQRDASGRIHNYHRLVCRVHQSAVVLTDSVFLGSPELRIRSAEWIDGSPCSRRHCGGRTAVDGLFGLRLQPTMPFVAVRLVPDLCNGVSRGYASEVGVLSRTD